MLARGSKGSDVMELQLNLMKLGFNPGACSGFYDARTEEAVMLFQKENSIPISGIADRLTEERIYHLLRRMSVEHQQRESFRKGTSYSVTTQH